MNSSLFTCALIVFFALFLKICNWYILVIFSVLKLPLEMMRTRGWWDHWMSQRVIIVLLANLFYLAPCVSSVSLHLIALNLCVFSADQAASEIPLSPQWLYAKPNEPKMVNLIIFSPHAYLIEFVTWFLKLTHWWTGLEDY